MLGSGHCCPVSTEKWTGGITFPGWLATLCVVKLDMGRALLLQGLYKTPGEDRLTTKQTPLPGAAHALLCYRKPCSLQEAASDQSSCYSAVKSGKTERSTRAFEALYLHVCIIFLEKQSQESPRILFVSSKSAVVSTGVSQ